MIHRVELVGGPEDGRVYEVAALEPYIRLYTTPVIEARYFTKDEAPETVPYQILIYEPVRLGARYFNETWRSKNDKGHVVYRFKGASG